MRLSSDQLVFWHSGLFKLNETMVTTWALMLVLALGSFLVTRKLATVGPVSRRQALLEIIVTQSRRNCPPQPISHVLVQSPASGSPDNAPAVWSPLRK